MCRAIEVLRGSHHLGEVVIAHGDASEFPRPPAVLGDLREIATRAGVRYDYRHFHENTGSARGQNRLAELFPAGWHFVTNPDVVFGGTCLRQLFAWVDRAAIGILEARQLPLEVPKTYDARTGLTSWASGACSLVRGELWRRIEGYDEASFFLYGDDVDFSWRVRLEGFDVVHVPTARVFHDKRLGQDRLPSELERYYSAIGLFMMARKWGTHEIRLRVERLLAGDEFADVREEIDRRTAEDRLPAALERAERVAQFTADGHYGGWRW